jgi:hypothetical protein
MRRLSHAALLTLLLGVLVVLAPTSVGSTTTRVVPVRADEVTVALERARTVDLDLPAQHVALYWRGNPRARVTASFSSDGITFGRPVDAGRDETGEQRRDGTTYGAVLGASEAVRVRVHSDRPLARLTVLGMRDGDARTRTTVGNGAGAVAAATQPPVRRRSLWGADESLRSGTPSFARVRKLIVHHTATSNGYADRSEAESLLRAIHRYHTVTQGWSDIGYNFLVDRFGTIYEGRWSRHYPTGAYPSGDDVNGNGVVGAHTGGWNSGSLGVAMLGTHTDRDISPAARGSLEALLAWAAARHGIDPTATEKFTNPSSGATRTTPNIAGHRDYGSTECPGGTLYATLPALRVAVAARVTGEPPDTTAPTRPTGLTAAPRRTQVSLRWTPSTDDSGLSPRYRVLRARSAEGSYRRVATVGQPAYVDTGLRRKRLFFYKVRAVDAAGNLSAFSNRVRVRTR